MTTYVIPIHKQSLGDKIWGELGVGGAITLLQSPFVSGFNRVSVVSCKLNLPMSEAIARIYEGRIDSAKNPSAAYFLKGLSAHLAKEASRFGFRTIGVMYQPHLESYFRESKFGKLKSDLIFAGGLSAAEMLVNPIDTLRTMWQVGEKLSSVEKGKKLSHLYKGASANGFRRFGIFLGFPLSERVWSHFLDNMTSFYAYSNAGIVIKSFPQSIQITLPLWILERLKNELQYNPKLSEEGKKTFRYVEAFQHILTHQGWSGFFRGFMPKVWSNVFVVMGADYLLEMGRKQMLMEKLG